MENAFGGTDKQREGRQASRRDRPHGRTDTRAASWRQKGCITDRDCLSQPAQQGRNLGARHSGKGTYDETMLALAGPRGGSGIALLVQPAVCDEEASMPAR